MSEPQHIDGEPREKLHLELQAADRAGQQVFLKTRRATLGSHGSCSLVLQSPSVQPVHCLVIQGTAGTIIRNFHADTRLNGEAFGDRWFEAGDTISIGNIDLKRRHPESHAPASDRALNDSHCESTAEIAARSNEILDLVERLGSLEQELGELKSTSNQLGQQTEVFEKQVAEKLGEIDRLEQQNFELMSRLEFTRHDRELIQELENRAAEIARKTAELETALRQKDEVIQKFAEQNSKLAQEVSQLRTPVSDIPPNGSPEFADPPVSHLAPLDNESEAPETDEFTDAEVTNVQITESEAQSPETPPTDQDDSVHPVTSTESESLGELSGDQAPETTLTLPNDSPDAFGEESLETTGKQPFETASFQADSFQRDSFTTVSSTTESSTTESSTTESSTTESSTAESLGAEFREPEATTNSGSSEWSGSEEASAADEVDSDLLADFQRAFSAEFHHSPDPVAEPDDPSLTSLETTESEISEVSAAGTYQHNADGDSEREAESRASDDQHFDDPFRALEMIDQARSQGLADLVPSTEPVPSEPIPTNQYEPTAESASLTPLEDEVNPADDPLAGLCSGESTDSEDVVVDATSDPTAESMDRAAFDPSAGDSDGLPPAETLPDTGQQDDASSPTEPTDISANDEESDAIDEELQFNFALAESNLSGPFADLMDTEESPDTHAMDDAERPADPPEADSLENQAESFFAAISRAETDNPYSAYDESSDGNGADNDGAQSLFSSELLDLFSETNGDTVNRLYSDAQSAPDSETAEHVDDLDNEQPTAADSEALEQEVPSELDAEGETAGEESYIQEYMKKLLGNGGETPPVTTNQPVPSSPSLLEKTFERELQKRNELLKPSEFLPKSSAPEKNSNLAAMRELANQTARSAIETSCRKKKFEQLSMIALIAAGVCFFIGATLAILASSAWSLATLGSVIFFALAGVGAWYYFELKNDSTMAPIEEKKQPAPAPAAAPAETKDPQGDANPAPAAQIDDAATVSPSEPSTGKAANDQQATSTEDNSTGPQA